jgi:hypothetical protein
MIRGHLASRGGAVKRPYVYGYVTIPSLQVEGDVEFLVDTGADTTLLAPYDALALGIDVTRLPPGLPTRGVGGTAPTATVQATLILDSSTFSLTLRILAPQGRQQQHALAYIPSLLGRDIISHFALFFEERSDRVLLLEPGEVATLQLP